MTDIHVTVRLMEQSYLALRSRFVCQSKPLNPQKWVWKLEIKRENPENTHYCCDHRNDTTKMSNQMVPCHGNHWHMKETILLQPQAPCIGVRFTFS